MRIYVRARYVLLAARMYGYDYCSTVRVVLAWFLYCRCAYMVVRRGVGFCRSPVRVPYVRNIELTKSMCSLVVVILLFFLPKLFFCTCLCSLLLSSHRSIILASIINIGFSFSSSFLSDNWIFYRDYSVP